jgi:predicted nucleotidyltransferase
MNALFQTAKEVADFMEAREWKYCIIGGLAVMRWGEPRTTQDVDITLLTGFGGEERFVDELLTGFAARGTDARAQALRNRVLLLMAVNGVGVDVALAGFSFEEEILKRASVFEFDEGCCLKTCSAEDLVVAKAFADRPKDWLDIEGVLIRQGQKLDIPLVLRLLAPLCELKEAPEIVTRFRKLVETTR